MTAVPEAAIAAYAGAAEVHRIESDRRGGHQCRCGEHWDRREDAERHEAETRLLAAAPLLVRAAGKASERLEAHGDPRELATTPAENSAAALWFGLSSAAAHDEYVASLYREIDDLKDLGVLPPQTTAHDVANVVLDAIAGHTSIGPIAATDLPDLLRDALEDLMDESDPESTQGDA